MGQNPIKESCKGNLLIEGQRICLREIRLSDVSKNYCDWMNDPEVNQYLESRFEKWSVSKLKSYIRKIKASSDNIFLAIIAKDQGRHIGNIKIGPVNGIHKVAEIGIIIGEKSFWGKGFASEAIELVVGYAFNELGLHKLTAGAYGNNTGSIKAFKRAGFSVEGVRKKHCLYNGEYVDGVMLGIIRR